MRYVVDGQRVDPFELVLWALALIIEKEDAMNATVESLLAAEQGEGSQIGALIAAKAQAEADRDAALAHAVDLQTQLDAALATAGQPTDQAALDAIDAAQQANEAALTAALPAPVPAPAVVPPVVDAATPPSPTQTAGAPADFIDKVPGELYTDYVARATAAGATSVLDQAEWNALP